VVEAICQRYHVLPEVARQADARETLRHMAILAHAQADPLDGGTRLDLDGGAAPTVNRALADMSYTMGGG